MGFVVSLGLAVLALILYQQAQEARQRAEESQGTAVAALISVNDTRATAQSQEASFRATINALDINRPVPPTVDLSPGGGQTQAFPTQDSVPPPIGNVATDPPPTLDEDIAAGENGTVTTEEALVDNAFALLVDVENYQRAETAEQRAFARSALLSTLQTQGVLESTVLLGHNGAVQDVDYSPNGEILASGSDDNTLILWDTRTRERIGLPFYGHTAGVTGVEFSPDGGTLASSSRDASVIVWDVATGEPLRTLTGHTNWVLGLAYSPDGSTLASSSGDGTAILWDAQTGAVRHTLAGHTDSVFSVAFSPDGQTLVSAGGDGLVILWRVETGEEIQRLQAHTSAVFTVAFSPDGQTLASGGGDNTAIVWRVDGLASREGVQPIYTLIGPTRAILSLGYSPDSATLAVGTAENEVFLWDVATAQSLGLPLGGYRDWVYSLAFSPNGGTLASGVSDGSLVLWDVSVEAWIEQACSVAGRSLTPEEWATAFPREEYRETCAR
jgi:WD40 repeat protein